MGGVVGRFVSLTTQQARLGQAMAKWPNHGQIVTSLPKVNTTVNVHVGVHGCLPSNMHV
jgi:hypothetical protein